MLGRKIWCDLAEVYQRNIKSKILLSLFGVLKENNKMSLDAMLELCDKTSQTTNRINIPSLLNTQRWTIVRKKIMCIDSAFFSIGHLAFVRAHILSQLDHVCKVDGFKI